MTYTREQAKNLRDFRVTGKNGADEMEAISVLAKEYGAAERIIYTSLITLEMYLKDDVVKFTREQAEPDEKGDVLTAALDRINQRVAESCIFYTTNVTVRVSVDTERMGVKEIEIVCVAVDRDQAHLPEEKQRCGARMAVRYQREKLKQSYEFVRGELKFDHDCGVTETDEGKVTIGFDPHTPTLKPAIFSLLVMVECMTRGYRAGEKYGG